MKRLLCWLFGHRWITSDLSGRRILFHTVNSPLFCCGRCGATEPVV